MRINWGGAKEMDILSGSDAATGSLSQSWIVGPRKVKTETNCRSCESAENATALLKSGVIPVELQPHSNIQHVFFLKRIVETK